MSKVVTEIREIQAEGMVTQNGFVVFKGSEVRDRKASFLAQSIIDLRLRGRSNR